MNRNEMLAEMRRLENLSNLTVTEAAALRAYRAELYPLQPSEMLPWELDQLYSDDVTPKPKSSMRMSGKGTRRVHHVLSGRALF